MNYTMYKAWLNYSQIGNKERRSVYAYLFSQIIVPEQLSSSVLATAVSELKQGIQSLLDITPQVRDVPRSGGYLRLEMVDEATESVEWKHGKEGFIIRYQAGEGKEGGSECYEYVSIIGGSDVGVLYGVFHLLRLIKAEVSLEELNAVEAPSNGIRMINQWDNADGSIERGYAGRSIFYRDGLITTDLNRIRDYARMLASVGLNAISINNVNVHKIETRFITSELLPSIANIAEVFRGYGIKLFLSINFAAPLQIGGLLTADPMDAGVRSWWKDTADQIYSFIPDFGGFVVKADSEHRPGPFAYGRDHADGANMLADALSAHAGIVIWRCFVYDCMQDWRDRKTDRARAAYDHFKPLDGRFRSNVLLQIKNGPMDFQVREPVSPLFGAMQHTNQMLEFQIAQEYTGQQRHLCYLVPQWKQVLDFDTHSEGAGSEVKRIVDGSIYPMQFSGIAAVSNIGDDECWTGHILAQANLYGYGRLIWNPNLSAEEIAQEWAIATFANDPKVVDTICLMLMKSWPIYESYTAPLGVGWMVAPNHHYGPDVDGYEYSRWGTYHFADRNGVGVDRTQATGTGYSSQYFGHNAEQYESLATCPDELLLFFHHVPYTYKLQSGKSVIQHIYDTHFEGAEETEDLQQEWATLSGKMDETSFNHVADRLAEQAAHAKQWRDIINTYFYRKSGIPDESGRTIY